MHKETKIEGNHIRLLYNLFFLLLKRLYLQIRRLVPIFAQSRVIPVSSNIIMATTDKQDAPGIVGTENDKIIFENQLDEEKKKSNETGGENLAEIPQITQRNVAKTKLKDGYERDSQGNPTEVWK